MSAFLTAPEVARLLRVHPATLAGHLPSLYKKGFPRPFNIGRCRRWSSGAIDAWVARQAKGDARSETDELLEEIRAF